MADIGRNDPCHCGSGKKYKKCCFQKDEADALEASKAMAKTVDKGFDFFSDSEEDFDYAEIEDIRNLPAGMYENLSDSESEYMENWDAEFELLETSEEKLVHFEKILYDKPEIVEKVELDPEILFDINVGYQKSDRVDEYIAFLKKFRNDFPEIYAHNAEYYDYSIIAYLIAQNKKEDIKDYFKYFEENPVEKIDRLMDLMNLLMALDEKEILLDLTDKVKNKVLASDTIFGKYDIILPLHYDMWDQYLDQGLDNINYKQIIAEYQARLPYELLEEELEEDWRERFNYYWLPYQNWELDIKPSKQEYKRIYAVVCDNFIRFLHQNKGLSIISAQYHSALIEDFNKVRLEELKNVKNKLLFDFSEESLDNYANQILMDLFFPDINKASSFFSAVYYFAEYLKLCNMIDAEEVNEIKNTAEELFMVVWESVKDSFTESDCFRKFPLW